MFERMHVIGAVVVGEMMPSGSLAEPAELMVVLCSRVGALLHTYVTSNIYLFIHGLFIEYL
jgi:flagellar motor component MotA